MNSPTAELSAAGTTSTILIYILYTHKVILGISLYVYICRVVVGRQNMLLYWDRAGGLYVDRKLFFYLSYHSIPGNGPTRDAPIYIYIEQFILKFIKNARAIYITREMHAAMQTNELGQLRVFNHTAHDRRCLFTTVSTIHNFLFYFSS